MPISTIQFNVLHICESLSIRYRRYHRYPQYQGYWYQVQTAYVDNTIFSMLKIKQHQCKITSKWCLLAIVIKYQFDIDKKYRLPGTNAQCNWLRYAHIQIDIDTISFLSMISILSINIFSCEYRTIDIDTILPISSISTPR